jgi:formylglycine-generating enzyme required for sulfatase activity
LVTTLPALCVNIQDGCSRRDAPRREDKAAREAERPPGSERVETGESFETTGGIRLRLVERGEFTMGLVDSSRREGLPEAYGRLEEPRVVRVDRCFYLGTTEVTNGQFQLFVHETGYSGGKEGREDFLCHMQDPDYVAFRSPEDPVIFVSWHDALAFCRWLGEQDGRVYSLPTEEQ